MKVLAKIFLWTYRVSVVLALLWLLHFPVVGISVLLGMAVLALVMNRRQKKPVPPREPPREDPEEKLLETFAEVMAAVPGVQNEDGWYMVPFANAKHGIWCIYEGEPIVGLNDSPHHEHIYGRTAEELKAELEREINAILREEMLQIIFYDADGKEHDNDLYPTNELEQMIRDGFYPARHPYPIWLRMLQILFLCVPSKRPKLVRAEVFSAKGTYDQVRYAEEMFSE